MTTLISAYVYLPTNKYRTLEKYFENGKKLLELKMNKIVFIDELAINQFKDYTNANTIILPTKLTDIYLYNHRQLVKNNSINTDAPAKDTNEYLMIQCNKTEWIRDAIEMNPFNSTNFVWLDFGLYHIFGKDKAQEPLDWTKLERVYQSVRMGSMWNLQRPELPDIWKFHVYKDIYWYFCGGVFGGHKDALIKFADLTRQKCLTLAKAGVLIWEVNIWYLVYLDNPDLFEPYAASHDETIINKY